MIPMNPIDTQSTASSSNPSTRSTTPSTPSTAALLADKHVVRGIEGTLIRFGVGRQNLPDAVAQVQLLALEATHGKRQPASVEEWRALCCTIAKRMVLKGRERDKRRRPYHAGLCEEPDEAPPIERSPGKVTDTVDLHRQLDALRGQFEAGEMPEHGETILVRTAGGCSAKEVGEELGLTESAVKNRLMRMRSLFRAKLAAGGLLTMMVVVAVLFAMPMGGLASRDVSPRHVPTQTAAHAPGPLERATALRAQAFFACDEGQLDRCVSLLDEARALDPRGEQSNEVRDARARIEGGRLDDPREIEAKPRH
ncbi:MAG: RNA polymerase sigma factor [Polyangiaceae bacterium]